MEVAGKRCYLLCVLSHKEKWETVIFTNILLQLWGVILGPLQCLCSIRHKSLKLFPVYDSSLFPLISSLTFFNLQYLYPIKIPNSYLYVWPAQVQALLPLPQVAMDTRTWLGIAFSKGRPAPGCSIPVILKSHTRWFSKLRTETEVWLELRVERTLTQLQNQTKLCSKKGLFMHAQNIPMGGYCQWQRHVTFLMRRMTFPFTHPWSCHSCGFIFYPD